MPYKFDTDKSKIRPENDRRRKLSEEQKEEIRQKYETGFYSQRQLALEYNVSRRLITFIIHPDRLKKVVELHDSKKYYNKEKHREYMKSYRDHKKQLHLEGKLIEK